MLNNNNDTYDINKQNTKTRINTQVAQEQLSNTAGEKTGVPDTPAPRIKKNGTLKIELAM